MIDPIDPGTGIDACMFLATCMGASLLSVVFGGGIISIWLSSPLWFLMLLLALPPWGACARCTSPASGEGGLFAVLLGGVALVGNFLLGIAVLFFLWPDDWLANFGCLQVVD